MACSPKLSEVGYQTYTTNSISIIEYDPVYLSNLDLIPDVHTVLNRFLAFHDFMISNVEVLPVIRLANVIPQQDSTNQTKHDPSQRSAFSAKRKDSDTASSIAVVNGQSSNIDSMEDEIALPVQQKLPTQSQTTVTDDTYTNSVTSQSDNQMISLSASPYQDTTHISLGIIIAGVILISVLLIGLILRWKKQQDQIDIKASLEDELIEKIQSGELESAINSLLEKKSSLPYKERIEELNREFYMGKKGYRFNELSPDEYYQVRNKVTLELLDILKNHSNSSFAG